MDAREAETMAAHSAYWRGRLAEGHTTFFGPVGDPAGVWGMALVRGSAAEVAEWCRADPAVRSGVCTFDVLPGLAPVTIL